MVENMKAYILSIVTAAIICGIARGILDEKSTAGKMSILLSGLLMAITLISPLKDISFRDVTAYFEGISSQANVYVQEGSDAALNNMRGIIKTKTEAYILDKADRMGLEIAVEVELDGSNDKVPSGVVINGDISPYYKRVLSAYIENNLGITKEHQQWT